jgi:serine/threonine protein kinase
MFFHTQRASHFCLDSSSSANLPCLAFKSFFAKDDVYLDDTALPTTSSFGSPNAMNCATRIFGRFQKLKELNHPCLASYLDMSKSATGRLCIVSEYYQQTVWRQASTGSITQREERRSWLQKVAYELLSALWYLHENNIVHGNLSKLNVFVNNEVE